MSRFRHMYHLVVGSVFLFSKRWLMACSGTGYIGLTDSGDVMRPMILSHRYLLSPISLNLGKSHEP